MKFGVTQRFDCNYLPSEKEQLLVCMAESVDLPKVYNQLMHAGFRRSGEQLYRPHCPDCQACNSVRVMATQFTPSKSQKRIINKNKDLSLILSDHEHDDYYPLYESYITQLHADGSMFPPSYEQYRNFIRCTWQHPSFLEARTIMQQIERAKLLRLPYLYLGYQIDDCRKMNYKTQFLPFERHINNEWQASSETKNQYK